MPAEPTNQQQTYLVCSCFRCTAQHVHALDADGCAILQELHFLVLSFGILPDAVAYHLKLKGVPKLCFYCKEVFWGLYQWGWMVIISYRHHCLFFYRIQHLSILQKTAFSLVKSSLAVGSSSWPLGSKSSIFYKDGTKWHFCFVFLSEI